MPHSRSTDMPRLAAVRLQSKAAAGGIAGMLAGLVYLLAQSTASGLIRHESLLAPLHRISAMLLGPEATSIDATSSFNAVAMGLLIHLPLSLWYGRLIAAAIDRLRGSAAIAASALLGIAIYFVNYHLIAPAAFPWFHGGAVTLVDHALFGALVGVFHAQLSRSAD
jgi:hypothetical protein